MLHKLGLVWTFETMEKESAVNDTLLKYLFCIYACAFLSDILTNAVLNIQSQNGSLKDDQYFHY